MSQSRLSQSQEQCLELVAQGMSSKEIAHRLGLSPRSVDTYLVNATGALKASNRREAARIFMANRVSQKLPSQSAPLVEPPKSDEVHRRTGLALLKHALFPIPLGGTVHELTAAEKLLYSARIGLSGVIVLLTIATTFMGLLAVF